MNSQRTGHVSKSSEHIMCCSPKP